MQLQQESGQVPKRRIALELMVPTLLVTLATLVFWTTDLDIRALNLFYRPEESNRWPLGQTLIWQAFYYGIPVLTGIICLFSIAFIFCASFGVEFCLRRRPQAVFLLLVFVLGPGALVNGVFKDNWGRPRPRQVEQLGGQHVYVPPLKRNAEQAGELKSFPAGHASVGFSFLAFWFLLRRRYSPLGYWVLAGGLGLGTLAGIGRMSAGGHFLSDVIWSAYIPFTTAWVLYYVALRTGRRMEAARTLSVDALNPHPKLSRTISLLAATGVLIGVSLSIPLEHEKTYSIPVEQHSNATEKTLKITVSQGDITLKFSPSELSAINIQSRVKAFGLPTNRIQEEAITTEGSVHYTFDHQGIFSEFGNRIDILVPIAAFSAISIHVDKGDIFLHNTAGNSPIPELDLQTDKGRVDHLPE